MDSYNYLWTLDQAASGSISGTVNVGESNCPSPIWSVAGSITGNQFTLTATNPTGGDFECVTSFTYSMVIASPGVATGTWVNTDGVSGSVTMTESSEPAAAVIPSNVDFGSVTTNHTATRRLTIQNVGSPGSLLVGFVSSPSPPFTITEGAGAFSLASGATATVTVGFQPSTTGTFSDSISINSNDPLSPTVVPLSGTADLLTTVTVWVDAFIPWNQFGPIAVLPTDFLCFLAPSVPCDSLPEPLSGVDIAGDGRLFSSQTNASSRVHWLETFDANTLAPIVYSTGAGISSLVEATTGATLATAQGSSTALISYPSQLAPGLVSVSVSGGGTFGFLSGIPFTPAINVNATFIIDLTNRECQLVGTYGGFPAFEAYVQGNSDPPVALLQQNVGPEAAWFFELPLLFFSNFHTLAGTMVPF
jgi:hypothetical protein